MKKKVIQLVIALLIVSGFGTSGGQSAGAAAPSTKAEISKLLTEEAIKQDIPPEIAKAVAFEESAWNQDLISKDGGIGVMQVTNDARFDVERLKNDVAYNISSGLQILNEKFQGNSGKLPTVNDNERDILESWYFAVLAYNGQVQENSPIYLSKDSNERNLDAYQEQVYQTIENSNLYSEFHPIPFGFERDDFEYGSGNQLYFKKDHYELPEKDLHRTAQLYRENEIVLSSARLREAPTTSSPVVKESTAKPRPLTLLSSKVYDSSSKADPLNNHYVWYKAETDDGSIGYVSSIEMTQLGERLSGKDRYKTAVAISQKGWDHAETVVLARGGEFPDALAGTPLAYQYDAPMLLTEDNKLTDSTKKELERLQPNKVIILGSSGAITDNVSNEIKSMGIEVDRFGGKNRFDTAAIIAENLPKKNDTAILAYGMNYPDALSIAPYAAKNGYPIYLSLTDKLPKETAAEIQNYDNVIVVGSSGVISEKALAEIPDYKRYAGKDRFVTNQEIIKNLPLGNEQAYFATGKGFADALTGAVLAAKNDAPLYLSWPNRLPTGTGTLLEKNSYDQFNLLGGNSVIDIEKDLADLK